jgi:hypothetical protein
MRTINSNMRVFAVVLRLRLSPKKPEPISHVEIQNEL